VLATLHANDRDSSLCSLDPSQADQARVAAEAPIVAAAVVVWFTLGRATRREDDVSAG
jgi:hypothetical protein